MQTVDLSIETGPAFLCLPPTTVQTSYQYRTIPTPSAKKDGLKNGASPFIGGAGYYLNKIFIRPKEVGRTAGSVYTKY